MMSPAKLLIMVPLILLSASRPTPADMRKEAAETLRPYVLREAAWALKQSPETVTAHTSPRSSGGVHDFYSEGDYWWPNPADPGGPYIQRDGLTNPDNFVAHRIAMIRFSRVVGALASAYKLTHKKVYAEKAAMHLRAWFIDSTTLMNANLQYAQAIKGVATGRGIGIIDTIQLMEAVQAAEVLEQEHAIDNNTMTGIREWFEQYLNWLTTSKYGRDEMNAKNNHGTCWVMQVACFAKLTRNATLINFCSDRFKNTLLPDQMADDGSFPLELKRTKPYGYSLFNLDAMATICQTLSTPENDLWRYETADGRSVKKGIAYLYPYIKDKNTWPFAHDVMYWDNWPVAQPSLVFGALAYQNADWLATWRSLDHEPQENEVIRNLPVRHPLIW